MSVPLHELGPEAVSRRHLIDEVKLQLSIVGDEFDCWIYGFLENKKYNVQETVAKLQRRFSMEVDELARYTFTDYMRESLRSGIIQCVGEDKAGRTVFYVTSRRDRPVSSRRVENRHTFDMMVSYGTRLRAESKRCQMVMLINQEKASLWSNMDMTFQAEIALRISKFYPGAVDKMYVCNMNRTLAAMAKPIFSRLPAIVSDRIMIITDAEMKSGKLLEYFDESVLPVALGGTNDCDDQEHWDAYAASIEDFYAQLKEAVLFRGLSVKEWELSCLKVPPPTSMLATPRSDAYSLLSLRTCCSGPSDVYYSSTTKTGTSGEQCLLVIEWKSVVHCFPRGLGLFFLEELRRWRLEVESDETEARYKILDEHIAARRLQGAADLEINLSEKKWYTQIPVQLQLLYRFCLLTLTVLNGIYFFAALVFLAVFGGNIVATLFFGFFVQWNYVFPLSAALVMSALQCFVVCSRAVDILVALARRKVIRPFDNIGSHLGGIAQMSFFLAVVVLQFVIFCVFAVWHSPIFGLQASFAVGWLCAAALVVICHALFLFDWLNPRHRFSRGGRLLCLPCFVLWNTPEVTEGKANAYTLRTFSYVICGIPVLLSLLFGIGFLISRVVGLAVAVCTAAIVASFIVTYYADSMSNALSGCLVRAAIWIASLVWVFDCYTFGFHDYSNTWFVPVLVSSFVAAWYLLFSFICLRQDESCVLLRVAIGSLGLLLCATWISTFPVTGWRMGLFCTCFLLHNVLGMLFNRSDRTNIGGVFVASAAVLLIIMAGTLLGWHGMNPFVTSPRSLPRDAAAAPLTPLAEYHRYPVCSLRTAGGLAITDFALLTQLVNAYPSDAFWVDFRNWFNTTDFTYRGVVLEFSPEAGTWDLHRFDSATHNQTVLVLSNKDGFSSMLTTTAWLGSMALAPLHIFLPTDWTNRIVYYMSFVTPMVDFQWRRYQRQLAEYLRRAKAVETRELVLTGSGIAGGIASMAGAHARTQTIVFGSPGLLHLLRLTGVSEDDYHHYVLAVGAANGVLDNVGGQDITVKQKLRCRGNAMRCLSMEYISSELLSSCDTSGRRHAVY
ncbi:uncharacterized protein Tco025E_01244 [Trypanosoma conorhini]|uniref:CRAL-TRIO domain-containing protein n=1 Tax=Trypanosoma conorhini TaxID=83891 RepID=A0A3R7NSH8_9TRYP|nr:uncharacterized protein Tco025E_01244 [Trypanosoma conorhini]RNF26383.1 hypothetical protein Tco025E_01244 [Trypanosoma conorhini]